MSEELGLWGVLFGGGNVSGDRLGVVEGGGWG